MEFNLMHKCAHDNYHILNETKMAMKIIGVCIRNALKEGRCVLSVQNIYSMPYGTNFSFSYYIFHFKMDLIGKIDKGPLLPVHRSASYLLIKETSLYFVHLVEI